MKRFLNKLVRAVRKPILFKDTDGATSVYRGESVEKLEKDISEKLNRNVVIIPYFLSKHE
ncbi:hypothetical protein [Clostridium perfringens]|uniref:Uncharacterized protein n=1 Tax=Clostridium perfringens TaxID=1502 RepID=A0AAP4ECC5_CLOPF|nr:hypothetical protein [Clostridium perfringens]MDH2334577.1 hypothetical protein [Clostridium perfringens]